MALSISRSLNVRRAEQPRLAWLYAMLFCSVTGCVWGDAIIEAGFLRQVGVRYLPLAIICNALISMVVFSLYNAFADRLANHKLLVAILGLSIVGIGSGALLLAGGQTSVAFAMLYILSVVLFRDLLNVHWPIYVNGFFDTQSAKRVIPILSSATRLAAICGGLTLPLLNRFLAPAGILLLMVLMQGLMLFLALRMRSVLGERPTQTEAHPTQTTAVGRPGTLAHLQEGGRYVAGSPYLRWLALTTLLAMVVLVFLNYQTGYLLLLNLKTVQNIANFTGLLNALGNLVALPIQLFLVNRLIGKTGVGNAALIYPGSSLLAVLGLTLLPGFISAGFGHLTRTVLRTTFYIPVDSLLYNAVPLRVKARARGFVSGYVMTAGSLTGGLLLLLNQQQAGPVLLILFGLLALAYLGSALQVRRQYGKAVVAMLEQEDYASLLAPVDAELAAVDDATLGRLAARLEQAGAAPDLQVFMAQIICRAGGERAVPLLEAALRRARLAGEAPLCARLLEVLAASGSNPAAAEPLYRTFLQDPAPQVRQAALAGLESSAGEDPLRFQALVMPLLSDPDPQVQAAALAAVVRCGGFYVPAAGALFDSLLTSAQPGQRAQAVRLLGRLADSPAHRAGRSLAGHLLAAGSDPDGEVRLAAALALEEAAGAAAGLPAWLPPQHLEQMLADPIVRVRCTAVGLLGRSPRPADRERLVAALSDVSPLVRLAAVESLVQAGPQVIEWARPLLEAPSARLRSQGAALLGRIDPAQFGPPLLALCLNETLPAAYGYRLCLAALDGAAPSPALNVLRCALAERAAERVDEVFELLRVIRPARDIDKIAHALRSPDPLRRADALEALEVLTSPQVARLLGPLCEPAAEPETLLAVSRTTWQRLPADSQQTFQELQADAHDPWLSEIARAAAFSGGLTLSPLQEDSMLSAIEKVIFLKEVPFFQSMTVDQLRILAEVCEEEFFPAETRLYQEGDPGGTLYVVVSGRVGIEQEKRKGSFARLATVEAHSYLGETDFFDDNCRSTSAIAVQDTLTLRLRREPLIALARQYPDLSLELIHVLSARLREANSRIAELTRVRPRELHKLYDQLSES